LTHLSTIVASSQPQFLAMPAQSQVPVLQRAVQVLENISEEDGVSAKSLSLSLGIPPATCYRILNTLVQAGWLRRGEGGEFSLSFGLARLSRLSSDMQRVVAALGPPLRALARQTGLTAKVSVQDGDDWLMIAREEAGKDLTISLKVGARAPVFLGSVGAVLCAGMAAGPLRKRITQAPPHADYRKDAAKIFQRIAFCRKHGYATDFAETHRSIHALSVPVCLEPLNTTGAITLFGLPGEVPRSRIKKLLARLQSTVRAIEKAL
jgi:DNA-binding IclR family transcriptional regulator